MISQMLFPYSLIPDTVHTRIQNISHASPIQSSSTIQREMSKILPFQNAKTCQGTSEPFLNLIQIDFPRNLLEALVFSSLSEHHQI